MTEATATPKKNRKELLGEVISNKMQKTVVVKVTRGIQKNHQGFQEILRP
jgi:ribosomal protein S17